MGKRILLIYMEYRIIKRYFLKGPKSIKRSIGLTPAMFEALSKLEEVTGDSLPEIVVNALDDFLAQAVRQGIIEAPKGVEITKQASDEPSKPVRSQASVSTK